VDLGYCPFAALNIEEATKVILQDPFVLEDLIDWKWMKGWLPETRLTVSSDNLVSEYTRARGL
jgi:hypothetical protein